MLGLMVDLYDFAQSTIFLNFLIHFSFVKALNCCAAQMIEDNWQALTHGALHFGVLSTAREISFVSGLPML